MSLAVVRKIFVRLPRRICDIKLQNLMLTRKGQVKILDFGLDRFASENGPTAPLTECGALTGTPDFIAPEQAEDARSADIRADIYSLGNTLRRRSRPFCLYLLTGATRRRDT